MYGNLGSVKTYPLRKVMGKRRNLDGRGQDGRIEGVPTPPTLTCCSFRTFSQVRHILSSSVLKLCMCTFQVFSGSFNFQLQEVP